MNLLNGSFTGQNFQVGANASETVTISNIASSWSSDLGTFNGHVNTNVDYTKTNATAAKAVVFAGGNNDGTTQIGTVAGDAKAIAAALNGAGLGFSASAGITTIAGTTSNVANFEVNKTDTFTVNGVAISLNSSTDAGTNRATAVAAINAQSANTGVVATDMGDKVKLEAADGRNIVTAFQTHGTNTSTAAGYGLTANDATGTATTNGATLSVTLSTSTTGNVQITGIAGGDGLANAAVAIGDSGTALNANDVTTATKATSMITAIDAALDSVNTSRASLGAIQNRFDSIVNSVLIASENQSAARSRIVDADFAQETAALTRGQILQQAGVAVLAQANAAPQNVLALLQ